ncbi:mannose-6-phosphate isomerase, class I [Microbacterium sp. NPDC076911]|uniref:mannose-6-phosphate isomerase, class I n=1 Tax=Microbacterium sp. NPDC076911 TaxID=3154958 RepID=UPI00344AF46E
MFIHLTNAPRNYAWGSLEAIAEFRGTAPSGSPEAELWFGTHQGSPTDATATLPPLEEAHETLAEWIDSTPSLLGDELSAKRRDLPILLKVLAAASPLSLQVHPTPEQAKAGFARENELGIALSDPSRNYKDPYPKPEIIVAVSERFDALCGFRPAVEVAQIVDALRATNTPALAPLLDLLNDPTNIAATLDWLLGGSAEVTGCVAAITDLASAPGAAHSPIADTFTTVREISAHYAGDPGIVVAMLMNRVCLKRGEGLYAPAGLLHAYLSGLGIELMTASDNVVRGGLTPKHIDTAELRSLLSFEQGPADLLVPVETGPVTVYSPPAPFSLALVSPSNTSVDIALEGPSIILADSDEITVADPSGAAATIGRGDAAFVSGDVDTVSVTGPGRAWVAVAHA